MAHRLRILVVDDGHANRMLICRFVATLGHDSISAVNGAEAVALCRDALPDLVLMDVMMPVMDGRAASAEIRRLCGERWLPIIFLSAKSSEAEQLEGLAIGDDYLPKPVNLAMLKAKIEVMARIAEMQQRLADNARRLEAYREHNEQEQQFTRHVLEHIVGYRECCTGPVKRWIKPARHLSGDVIAHAYSPTGAFHVLIADSTGHGLAAAISAVPAVDTFHTMTRRGYPIGSIAREINVKLRRLLPADRFVAAALVGVDPYRNRISVWNGGIPAPVFVAGEGRIAREWPSRHPPLGILDDAEFDPRWDSWQWDEQGEVFICSDGLIEAENRDGEPFGRQRLLDTIGAARGDEAFAAVIDAVTAHLAGRDAHDDLSLASIACTGALYQPCAGRDRPSIETPQFAASNWTLALRFGVNEIARDAVQPLLTRWLNQIGLDAAQFGELQLIFSELCHNAVDHGVLGLDSRLKREPDGYDAYQRDRAARLAALAAGAIEVRVAQIVDGGRRRLELRVKDSGRGFDPAPAPADAPADGLPYGRGIPLVRKLAAALRFEANGTEAVVDYPL